MKIKNVIKKWHLNFDILSITLIFKIKNYSKSCKRLDWGSKKIGYLSSCGVTICKSCTYDFMSVK